MWSLFEKSFIVDMGLIASSTHDRQHADTALENYVTSCLMNIIATFFSSPFSDQSTTVQVIPLFILIMGRKYYRLFSIFQLMVYIHITFLYHLFFFINWSTCCNIETLISLANLMVQYLILTSFFNTEWIINLFTVGEIKYLGLMLIMRCMWCHLSTLYS